ncbi:MAG: branched-chain amino acid ABC transporter permease/ATP-binding protein [Actinomycetota bacterium]
MIELAGIAISQQALLVGLVTGLTYAAFAAGFVLIYRSTGVLNFAHGEMGAFGLAVFVLLLVNYDINWWLAFLLAVAACALAGAVVELVVIRRLFDSPRLVVLIATIGVGQILLLARVSWIPDITAGGSIPTPFDVTWEPTDSLRLQARELTVLVVVPLLIACLGLFLTRTRFGLAVRASASNPDTARVFGTSPRRVSTIVWAISGGFAAATAILIAPINGTQAALVDDTGQALAEVLLLRVLIVSLLARMRSLPGVVGAGIAVGVVEKIVRDNVATTNQTIVDLFLFLAVLIVVLVLARSQRDTSSWSLAPRTRPVPERLRSIWWVRHLNHIGFIGLFTFLGVLPLAVTTNAGLFTWSIILIWAMVALSLTILTGWSGQLSLGQFAFVGVGGLTTVALSRGHDLPVPFDLFDVSVELPWGLSVLGGTIAGIVFAMIVGIPALRVRGLFLTVATLAFAVASARWLFVQDVFTGGSSIPRPTQPPKLFGIDFDQSRTNLYYLCLGSLVAMSWIAARIRATGIGRTLVAVRDNEDMAAASTVPPARVKLAAFAVSGGMAAFAGGLLVSVVPSIEPSTTFAAAESIQVVVVAIIGGLGSVAGPVLGALWVRGIPEITPDALLDLQRLFTSNIGLLVLLMYFPGGLLQVVYLGRDRLLKRAEARLPEPETPTATPAVAKRPPARPERPALADATSALAARDIDVRFGGNIAVDGVSFDVAPGELVGLIGTNGAGKSTLLNAISGFVPATGTISVRGVDVSGLDAAQRHRVGLGRGFQDARLYPDLTVRECLQVALEARQRSPFVASMLGLPPSGRRERSKRADADDIIDYLGLGRYADQATGNLSTGTRRIVELGSLLAVDAQILLLDEPTGGVAQRETEAFGPLIKRIQAELDAAVVVIEHDMPLVMSISDRVYCLEAGTIIAQGTPDAVRNNPDVISSYLGTDERAIQRSNAPN